MGRGDDSTDEPIVTPPADDRETHVARRLPPDPRSAGEARRLVREVLHEAGHETLVDTAQLLTSEVVTNALVYAATPVDLSVRVDPHGVLVEVGDGSPHLPHRSGYGPTTQTGRGLALLELQASAWGARAMDAGKLVWFRVDLDHEATLEPWPGSDNRPAEQEHRAHGQQSQSVVFLDLPLAMFAAWRQHAETVLREYLLVMLDDDVEQPLEQHATATEAIAVLTEGIPEPAFGESPADVLARVSEPLVTAEHVRLRVPFSSLLHFRTLDAALDAATTMADAGDFLSPPILPELRQLRRWLCEQVDSQSRGAPPSAWEGSYRPEIGPEAVRGAVRLRSDDAVSSSQLAMIAADDHNQIVAVSEPALALLGYDSQQHLVGHRLVAVIPDRYRQAHLAGFTQHLLTGRQPLLGTEVLVPALHRDGSEVEVMLRIERQHHEGHVRFVATLRSSM